MNGLIEWKKAHVNRDALREQLDAPIEMINYMGYALFVGRKPE
jgi:hypothetical protein